MSPVHCKNDEVEAGSIEDEKGKELDGAANSQAPPGHCPVDF